MDREEAIKMDRESLASDLSGTCDLLRAVICMLKDSGTDPNQIKASGNAVLQCSFILERTADEINEAAKRAAVPEEAAGPSA